MSLSILQEKKQSIGAINRIKLVPIEKLPSNLVYNNEKTELLTQIPDVDLISVYHTEDKASDNNSQNYAEIDLFNQSIQFFVPLKNKERIAIIKKLLNAKLAAIIYYNAGEAIIVGNKEECLRMSYTDTSGDNVTTVAGFTITLQGDFSEIPPFYSF